MLRAGLLAVLLVVCGCCHSKVITIRHTVHEPAPRPSIPCIDCGDPNPFDKLTET